MSSLKTEVAVVGGGPAGLLAALLVARAGVETAVIAPPPPEDARTSALLEGSLKLLREAGLWAGLAHLAAPLRSLRIVDAGRRLLRAPEAIFHASELGLDAFGWNVPNVALTRSFEEALAALPNVRMIRQPATESLPADDHVLIRLADGDELRVRLAIAADGRKSLLREAAGIGFKARKAPQSALAFSVAHRRPHGFVSTELHYEEGPFTLVPMPGDRSSVVWAVRPDRADALRARSPEALSREATRASGRLLGDLEIGGPIGCFPITIGAATRFAARRTLLVGEAGHVLPPIGAQGLNLGFRDAAAAAKAVCEARRAGRDVGGDEMLKAYDRARRADVWSRAAATDLLNRSLLSDLLPSQLARSVGLGLVSRIGPLRRFVMREGLLGGPAF